MRKVSFALAVGFVLVACGGADENQAPKAPVTSPVVENPAPPVTAEAPKEEVKPKETLAELQQKTLKGFVEAMNAHDAKKLAGLYTDSAVLKMGGPDATGRDAIAQSFQKIFDGFKDYTCAVNRAWVKDDVVVSEWALTGTHTGDFWGVKGTEKKVGLTGADVAWYTPDGQIKEHHVYADFGTIFSQIGQSKMKARAIPTLAKQPPQTLTAKGTPEEAKNLDVAKAVTASFESKKDADFLAALTDASEWDDMIQAHTMKGKADAKKFFKELTTAFPDVKMAQNNAWGVGDFAIVEFTMTGTNKGAFFGMPATKKPISERALDIIQVKDGKAVKGWTYMNGADLMTQLGVGPKPAADAKAADKKPAADAKAADKKPAGDKKAVPIGDKKPADKAPAKK
jgi:steroid delta-isomerase-like uncharacterized protein